MQKLKKQPINQMRKVPKPHNPTQQINEKRLLVGKINGLFGFEGWVKIFSHTVPRKNILSYQPWLVKITNNWQEMTIVEGREHGKNIIAKIQGIESIEQAQPIVNTDIFINQSQLPKLQKSEHYWHDLIGLTVINKQNITLGKVIDLVDTQANQVLIIKGKKEHWLPYLPPFLIKVDTDKKQILVDWNEDGI